MNEPANRYDQIPYPDFVHPQTHPDRLATIATLFGMTPPSVTSARVLELGCGQGGNLIPFACSYPESDCVGIDLSAQQIRSGQSVVESVGISNITLRGESILDFPKDSGSFDYIIAHGVYSWVPKPVREKILTIIANHLNENGVAFVSYNTFPGWHQRRMVRDMMRFHTKAIEQPRQQIESAKAFLTFMTQAIPPGSAYSQSLKEEYSALARADESYLFHEQLEEINEPLYFHEFIDQASSQGLQFLHETDFGSMQLGKYPKSIAESLKSMDLLTREQYLDFLIRRTFRQTLLCHQAVQLDRNSLAKQVPRLMIGSPAKPEPAPSGQAASSGVALRTPSGLRMNIESPVIAAAITHLAQIWPNVISLEELSDCTRRSLAGAYLTVSPDQLAENIFLAFMADAIHFQTTPTRFCTHISSLPVACPLAKHQAATSNIVTGRMHHAIQLDPLARDLLVRLDGATDVARLVADIRDLAIHSNRALTVQGTVVSDPDQLEQVIRENLPKKLDHFRRHGLLIG